MPALDFSTEELEAAEASLTKTFDTAASSSTAKQSFDFSEEELKVAEDQTQLKDVHPDFIREPMFADPYLIQDFYIEKARTEGVGYNPYKFIEVIDRPRAGAASGIIEFLDQPEFNWADIKSEIGKGLTGEQHPQLSEDFHNRAKAIINDDSLTYENSPVKKFLQDTNSFLKNRFGLGTHVNIQDALLSGVPLALYKLKTAETDSEKLDANLELNTAVKSYLDTYQNRWYQDMEPLETTAWTVGFGSDITIDLLTYASKGFKVIKKGGGWVYEQIPESVVNTFAKAANTTTEKAKTILTNNRVGRSLQTAAETYWTMFSTKHNLKKLGPVAEIQEKFMNLVGSARVQAGIEGRQLQERISQFADELNLPESEVEKFITEAVERGGAGNVNFKDLPENSVRLLAENDNIRYEVWSLSQKNAAQLQKEIDAGVRISPLSDQPLLKQTIKCVGDECDVKEDMLQYMIRAITPEARKQINQNRKSRGLKPLKEGDEGSLTLSAQHSSALARKEWEGLTIADINELAKKGELPNYEGIVFKEGFFYSDPAIAQALRDSKHYRAMAARQLADDIINPTSGFAISPDLILQRATESGWVAEKNKNTVEEAFKFLKQKDPDTWNTMGISNNPLTEGFVMDSRILNFVDRNINSIHSPDRIAEFLGEDIVSEGLKKSVSYWSQATSWWKAWTLSIFPSYHFRNNVGNLWNNFVMGVNPKFYPEAAKIQEAISFQPFPTNLTDVGGAAAFKKDFQLPIYQKFKTKNGTEYSYAELRDIMMGEGVIGKGFMSTDIETSLRAEMGDARWLTLSRENKAIEYGKRFAEAQENNARIANFLDGINNGLSPKEAADRVKIALFDYSDLTPFEQKVMRNLMPFYTWTRKNIPYQVSMMVKHPGKYKAVDTLRRDIEAAVSEEDPNEKFMASWMLENYPTKVKIDEETGNPRYFILGGWLPAADVWKLMSAPRKVVTDNLHPVIKIAIEQIGSDDTGVISSLFSGQKFNPDQDINYIGMEIPETWKNNLNNLRVLATADNFYQSFRQSMTDTLKDPTSNPLLYKAMKQADEINKELTGKPLEFDVILKPSTPLTAKGKTAEAAILDFLTGIKTVEVIFDQLKVIQIQEAQKKLQRSSRILQKAETTGTEQAPEVLKQIEETVQDFQRFGPPPAGFAKGGMLDQARQLFRRGGYLRTQNRYAEGGEVKEDRDSKSVSTKDFQEYTQLRPELRDATDWRMYSGHGSIVKDVDKIKKQYPKGFDYMLDQNTKAQTRLLDRLQFDNEDVAEKAPEPLKELDSYLLDKAPYSVGVALGDENSYNISGTPAVGVVTPETPFGSPKTGRLAGQFRSDQSRIDTAMHETGHYQGLMADTPLEVLGEFKDMFADQDSSYEAATTGLDLYRSLSRGDDLSMEQAIRYLAAQGVNLYDQDQVKDLKENIISGVERLYQKSNGAIEFTEDKKAALESDINLEFEKIPDALYYVQFESTARSNRLDNLTKHHLKNLANNTAVERDDGSISTVYTAQFEEGGKNYIIPTIWDGKELSFEDAKDRAFEEGVFEVFDTQEAADAFDYMIHNENPIFQQEYDGRMEIMEPKRAQQYLDRFQIKRKPMGFAKGGIAAGASVIGKDTDTKKQMDKLKL